MLKFAPILLAILYGLVMYRISAWKMARDLSANSNRLVDPTIKVLTDRMAKAIDLPAIDVRVYEIEPINGLAAPDGRIFITRGFIRKYRAGEVSSDELASVIAHELGHVALGHSRRRMIVFTGQNAFRTAIVLAAGRFLPFAPILRWISGYLANGLTALFTAKLSRNDEYEADAYAAALLVKAGIGTEAQTSLLRKLDRLSHGNSQAVPAWFLSHPDPKKRVTAIENLAERWRATGEKG